MPKNLRTLLVSVVTLLTRRWRPPLLPETMKSGLPEVQPEDHGFTLYAIDRSVFYGFLALAAAAIAIACWTGSLLSACAGGWWLRSAFAMRRHDEHPMTPAMKLIVNELNNRF